MWLFFYFGPLSHILSMAWNDEFQSLVYQIQGLVLSVPSVGRFFLLMFNDNA